MVPPSLLPLSSTSCKYNQAGSHEIIRVLPYRIALAMDLFVRLLSFKNHWFEDMQSHVTNWVELSLV